MYEEISYKNGLQDGVHCIYTNGKLEQEKWFDKGYKYGVSRYYFRSGELRGKNEENEDGTSTSASYYKDGSLMKIVKYKNDQEIARTHYYNGKVTNERYNYTPDEELIKISAESNGH